MNSFDRTKAIGDSAVALVVRWLLSRGSIYDGRLVRTDKGRASAQLQRTLGDVLFNSDEMTVCSMEIKAERERRPNFFLETWSNASADPQWQKQGWLYTLEADWLSYYFVAADDLYTMRLPNLQRWAFNGQRRDGSAGRVFDFPEREQRAHEQLNRTMGRCVPIEVVDREVGFNLFHPAADLRAGAA